jgi:cellulose synthase (UDP-forming)
MMTERPSSGMLAPLFAVHTRRRLALLVGLWGASGVWFWLWWLRPEHVIGALPYAVATTTLGWLWLREAYFFVVILFAHRPAAPLPAPGALRVAMITTKTPSEPFAIVEATLRAMLAQPYPHDTWLADEDPAPETADWCRRHGVKLCSRKGKAEWHRSTWPRRTRCKEGNLAYFYDNWGYRDYDIVVQLDADHVPGEGYLDEMLRPFADPRVGYVSAPSICAANAGQSWAARARLQAEAAFHGVLQSGYTGVLSPMCIGSHYAVRTRALREIGGLGPELAEDHSTTMMMNAAGWKGAHAIDAIAIGDGPASSADMMRQEFQWSRSLAMLLLEWTPRFLPGLAPRGRFLFLFCQSWYPLSALAAATMWLMPPAALVLDLRYADVTYAAFLLHAAPPVVIALSAAFLLRAEGVLRPRDSAILGWERMLFPFVQWPWVLAGCLAALSDRLTGRFVDFRITPKGEGAARRVPPRILALYAMLAAVAAMPVLVVDGVQEARGFYLLALMNAGVYVAILLVLLAEDGRGMREAQVQPWRRARAAAARHAIAASVIAAMAGMFWLRGVDGLHALAEGTAIQSAIRADHGVTGAGMGGEGATLRFALDLGAIISLKQEDDGT